MQPLRTSTLILISLAATVVFYAGLALMLASHEPWLHSVAGAHASLAERIGSQLQGGVRAAAFTIAVGMGLFLAYRILANGILATRRIAPDPAPPSQVAREVLLCVNALLATGAQGAVYAILREAGYSRRYDDIAQHGWAYAIFSALVFLILYDAWSYFWHVAYHRLDALYRVSHNVHHLSVVTTPWTTFQGSPIELLPATIFSAIMAAALPLATPVLVAIMVGTLVYTMMQHGGLEFFPRGTATHPLGRWLVTPTYHQMHHEDGDRNIALYFNWWDRLMGTKSAGYEARFEKVTAPAVRSSVPSPQEGAARA